MEATREVEGHRRETEGLHVDAGSGRRRRQPAADALDASQDPLPASMRPTPSAAVDDVSGEILGSRQTHVVAASLHLLVGSPQVSVCLVAVEII